MPKSAHVNPNPKGGWNAKPAGQKPIGNYPTQREAQNAARDFLKGTGGGELVVHDRDNLIRQKDTISPAKDPYPPKG